jgi:hypothetical protein
MGYIGNSYSQQAITPATDFFSGNGVTTTFQLTRPVQSNYALEVVVNNVQQNPANAYTISSSNQLVLTGAPSTGTNNIYVVYNAIVAQVGTVGQGVVGNQQLGSISNINAVASNMTLQTNGSTVVTLDQNQSATFVNTTTFANNIIMSGSGYLALPTGTTAQRIAPAAGSIRYNSTIGAPEQYIGGAWQSLLGTSSAYPAVSATAIYNANNSAPSGYYWIKPAGLSQPFQAYCKMDYGGGWMNVARLIPEISSSPVLTGFAGGSGAGDMVGTDYSNPLAQPMSFINGVNVFNSQAQTYGCPGGSYPSQIQTTAAFRTYFPSISQCRVKVWIGTNDGNVVCATVSGFGSATMITGSSNILGICNNTPNRWSDLVGTNQVAEWYGTPPSSTVLYTTNTACGGGFYSRVLELYIKV